LQEGLGVLKATLLSVQPPDVMWESEAPNIELECINPVLEN